MAERNYPKEYAASRRADRRADNIARKRHRRKYEKENGPIPAGKELDHVGMNPRDGKNVRAIPKSANRKKQPKTK